MKPNHDKPRCAMCGKTNHLMECEPSRRYLIFGGFKAHREYRCPTCEKKLAKELERLIDSL